MLCDCSPVPLMMPVLASLVMAMRVLLGFASQPGGLGLRRPITALLRGGSRLIRRQGPRQRPLRQYAIQPATVASQ